MTAKQFNACEIAVIGAGPYGLSVAAHLKHAGLSTRVFGEPMSFWRQHMPKGMRLARPGTRATFPIPAASCRSTPSPINTAPTAASRSRLRISSPTANGFGIAVPDVDRRLVRVVEATGEGFQLELDDGEIFAAHRVVVATGLANQDYRPREFRGLPAALVSHACDHDDFAPMRGKHVAVIGRGQSATNPQPCSPKPAPRWS